eukprot:jgi/Mesvir1/638/Mv17255-RA.1
MENLWKSVYLVGTEWDKYDAVYSIPWDFSHLEKAIEEEGGKLHGKKVYMFGVTEPQLVQLGEKWKVTHIPAIVAITSPEPPSDKIGVKSVQMEGDGEVIPMRDMKMDWVPFIDEENEGRQVERVRPQVFVLNCILRKAALKRLKPQQVKKYEYCLPYIYQPTKDEHFEYDSSVSIMYPMPEPQPPVVAEFDWKFDTLDEFCDNLVDEEALPKDKLSDFKEFARKLINEAKAKVREVRRC